MELHTVIVSVIVIAIVLLQSNIFRGTYLKIGSYLNIFKNPKQFTIHKVFIPIDEIDTINSEEILNNLEYYSQNPILNKKIFKTPEIENTNNEEVLNTNGLEYSSSETDSLKYRIAQPDLTNRNEDDMC